MIINNEDILTLITCPKTITKPPRKLMKSEFRSFKNSFELSSIDGNELFLVFIRQSQILPEDFSIGLRWRCKDLGKDITLFRCNGAHGGNISIDSHFVPHTHQLSIDDFNREIFKERTVDVVTNYSTFDGALEFFCTHCNIQNARNHIEAIKSTPLFL